VVGQEIDDGADVGPPRIGIAVSFQSGLQ